VSVTAEEAGKRLDQFLAAPLDVSRARVQQSISEVKVLVNDAAMLRQALTEAAR
jgi:23S rRNA-/tRNA-specific pseudouridylate synthase